MEGIGEESRDHFVGWIVLDGKFHQLDTIGDEELPDVDVACTLTVGGATIGIKVHNMSVFL